MQLCWTLLISTLILLGGFGLYSLSVLSEFTAAVMPAIYIGITVMLPAIIVGPLWLDNVGARIRQWRLWNGCGRNVELELDPALTDVEIRTNANVAYAYVVEYDAPSWESDIPLEALFTFVLPGTRHLALRELPTVFVPTSLITEPLLGWLLPYVGVQAAPYPLTLENAFKSMPGRDVVLLNPSDPHMPLDGFVAYDEHFFETLHHLEYFIVPVRIRTARRLEHTYRWYGAFVPALACLFGVAAASLPLMCWSWLRAAREPATRIRMGAPVAARDTTYRGMREAMLALDGTKEKTS